AELVREQTMLRTDHVAIGVMGEPRTQTIAGLARFSRADGVRKYQVVALRIQRLPGTEQRTGELLGQKNAGWAPWPVKNEPRIGTGAGRVKRRRADCRVVELELGHGLSARESKIAKDVVVF